MNLTLFPITSDIDILAACKLGRAMAATIGFRDTDLSRFDTAVLEIARNFAEYAKDGEIGFGKMDEPGRRGILVVVRDRGTNIPELEEAMQDEYAIENGRCLHFTGAQRFMDDFKIFSRDGKGTVVTMQKWLAS
jgi:anti-sigma regulatory factor (Ser/Thr protein kinase)